MSKKILITGSAGFIFSNVVLHMQQYTDFNIVGVDKLTYAGSLLNAPQTKRYKLHIGDVSDYDFMQKIFAIEKPDIVVHGAAESDVDRSINSSACFMQTNVIGTHSMLEAALHSHMPEKFINFSTDECFGHILEGSFTEQSPIQPRNPYSASKASADLLGQTYYTTHNVPVITTRTCNVFGPRQKDKLIPTCVKKLMAGEKIPVYGKGEQIREFLYTGDLFKALMCIIEKGMPGQVYNIGSNYESRNIDTVKKIINFMGADESAIEFVKDRKAHDFRYSLDSSKIMALGWSPERNFDEALQYTINWYKKNSWFWK